MPPKPFVSADRLGRASCASFDIELDIYHEHLVELEFGL